MILHLSHLKASNFCITTTLLLQKLHSSISAQCKIIFKDSYIFEDFPEYWLDIAGEKSLKVETIPKDAIKCMTDVGVYFKLFCNKYRIDLFTKNSLPWLREFVESALHYRPAKVYCEQKELAPKGYDHNGSYRACKSSPYWKTYGLPRNTPTDCNRS